MITAEKKIKIDAVAILNPVVDTNIVHEGELIIQISDNDPNYPLFEDLLKSLNIQIKETITSGL